MAIGKSYCKDCGCTVGHKPDCSIWERESNKRAEAVRNQCKHGQLARSCNICELEQENEKLKADVAMLRNAAIAVVDRWDTPLWKDVAPTADFIGRLRTALSATASSDAWLKEQKAKWAEEYLKRLRSIPSIGLSERQFGELRMAAELRS